MAVWVRDSGLGGAMAGCSGGDSCDGRLRYVYVWIGGRFNSLYLFSLPKVV